MPALRRAAPPRLRVLRRVWPTPAGARRCRGVASSPLGSSRRLVPRRLGVAPAACARARDRGNRGRDRRLQGARRRKHDAGRVRRSTGCRCRTPARGRTDASTGRRDEAGGRSSSPRTRRPRAASPHWQQQHGLLVPTCPRWARWRPARTRARTPATSSSSVAFTALLRLPSRPSPVPGRRVSAALTQRKLPAEPPRFVYRIENICNTGRKCVESHPGRGRQRASEPVSDKVCWHIVRKIT